MRNAIIGHFDTKMAIIGQERPYFDPLLTILSPFFSVLMYCFFCTDFVLEKRVFCTEFPYAYDLEHNVMVLLHPSRCLMRSLLLFLLRHTPPRLASTLSLCPPNPHARVGPCYLTKITLPISHLNHAQPGSLTLRLSPPLPAFTCVLSH